MGIYIEQQYRNNRNVILNLIQRENKYECKEILYCISMDLRNDKEVMLEIIKKGIYIKDVLEFLGDNLKNDKDIILSLLSTKEAETYAHIIFGVAGDDVKNDKEVIIKAIKSYGKNHKHIIESIINSAGNIAKEDEEILQIVNEKCRKEQNEKKEGQLSKTKSGDDIIDFKEIFSKISNFFKY